MRLKNILVALPLLAFSSPLLAQEVVFVKGTGAEIPVATFHHDDPVIEDRNEGFSDMADKMGDPLVQDGVSRTVERMVGAMMNMRVGPLAEAIEDARPGTVNRRIRRDSTVGDLAGRNADYLPERLGDESREMMGMMGGFARAMATMMPEFERLGRELKDSVRVAKHEASRRN